MEVPGGCRVVYRPHNPKCGARVWIESLYDVLALSGAEVKVICLDSEELNALAMTEAEKTIATAPQLTINTSATRSLHFGSAQ